MIPFYLSANCQNCNNEILNGPCVALVTGGRGMPVIPYDIGATTIFHCDECGEDNYTGDFELRCYKAG